MNQRVEHFSYSQLSTFLRCQKQYWYRYIEHVRSPSNLNLLRGNSYHNAVAYGYSHLINRRLPPLQELLNIYSDTWDDGIRGNSTDEDGTDIKLPKIIIGDKNPGQIKDAGIILLTKYYNEIMPNVLPEEVETRKTREFNYIHLIAYMDVIDWHGTVIDHKTVSRAKSPADIVNDIQSSFYGIVLGKNSIDFEFHEAIDKSSPEIRVIPFTKNADDLAWCGDIIKAAWKQIHMGLFVPNPTSYLCSPEYCGYYQACRMPASF